MHKRLAITIILVLAAVSFVFAASDPQGPSSLTQVWAQRNTPFGYANISALAGNITELTITANTQTRTWQGYVGNISGYITLDDANNNTLYNWQNAEPRGQIYATTKTTTIWANISCFDYFSNGSLKYNLTELEADLGLNATEKDGVNETFNETDNPLIYVGSVVIANQTCWTANLFQSDAAQNNNFYELLLTDNTTDSIIYTAILENRTPGATNDLLGFNNISYDFQMLVGENGHGTDTATTPYYFYVELI